MSMTEGLNCRDVSATIYLASGSPRRNELFERFWGHNGYSVCVPEFDEHAAALELLGTETPVELAKHLTSGKMEAVKALIDANEQYIAVAADTIVVIEGRVLGKPQNCSEAEEMLKLLSGRCHQVITAVALLVRGYNNEQLFIDAETTFVEFSRLDQQQIDWYISTGEPLDKAGAYGIQGFGSALIKKIDGCYYNVMGLPVNRLMNMLCDAAVKSPEFSFISCLLPWS